MQSDISSCRSCSASFSHGRGFAADNFCSIRCRDWFDSGNQLHGEACNGRGPLRVVASGNPNEIGKPIAIRPGKTIGPYELADALGVHHKAVAIAGIIGRKSTIRHRVGGRWQINIPASKAKRVGCLASDGHGAFHFHRLPTSAEAEIIRGWMGLKPVDSKPSPEATDHFQKDAVNRHLSH